MPDPDAASAALAAIRETIAACLDDRTGPNVMLMRAMAREADSAVAAVERVLELHRRRHKPVRTTHVCAEHVRESRQRDRDLQAWREAVIACPDCTVTEKWVCAEPSCRRECPDDDEWPCPTYLAITSALTGQEAGDGLETRP